MCKGRAGQVGECGGVMKHLGILQLHPLSTVGLSQNGQGETGASFIPQDP